MELRLDPDDVTAAARGVTIIDRGTFVEALDGDRDAAAIVSEHERLHVSLNRATAFGLLLHACANHRPESLAAFVGACRTTHEAYATYLSVWIGRSDPLTALANYPTYTHYYELGHNLAEGFAAGSVAARCAVSAACQAAMQADVAGAARQLEDTASRLSIPADGRPDERLTVLVDGEAGLPLLAATYPNFWSKESLPEALERRGIEGLGLDFDRVSRGLTQIFYERFACLLREAGWKCLPWDGHLKDPGVLAVMRLGEKPFLPLPLNLDGQNEKEKYSPLPNAHLSLRYLDSERWLQRDAQSPMLAIPFAGMPEASSGNELCREHLIAQAPGARHTLLIVRPLDLLLDQYEVDAESESRLRAAAIAGVVTAIRMVGYEDGERLTVLAFLSDPTQLSRLAELPTDLGILGSVSMTCAYLEKWASVWLPQLHTLPHLVLHCDMPLSHWLEAAEAEAVPARLRFAATQFATESPTPTEVLAIDYFGAEGKVDRKQVVLGSPTAIGGLILALDRSTRVHAVRDESLITDSSSWRAEITRLMTEEPWFDRRGVEYLARSRSG